MAKPSMELIDRACFTAEEFVKFYYEHFDKRRGALTKLYLGSAVMVWNGCGHIGKDNIIKFYMDLPDAEHRISCLDAHKILGAAVANQLAYLIIASGTVEFQGEPVQVFTQTFMITKQEDKWKIVSDCVRFA